MNLRRRLPGYQLSEAVRLDVNRIQAVWRHSREHCVGEKPWRFDEFNIAAKMYAPVVMRFQSAAVQLNDPSVRDWLRRGLKEAHIVEEEELDWLSESISSVDHFPSDR